MTHKTRRHDAAKPRPSSAPTEERAARSGKRSLAAMLAEQSERAAVADEESEAEATPDEDLSDIVARPDGFHWVAPDGKQEFGPFETLEAAQAYKVASLEPAADVLEEAESEFGISDWTDPDTGEPAEGPCPPHLERE